MYLLCEGALVPDMRTEQDEKSMELQRERGAVSVHLARVVVHDGRMSLPQAARGSRARARIQSRGRGAQTTVICCAWPRVTLG